MAGYYLKWNYLDFIARWIIPLKMFLSPINIQWKFLLKTSRLLFFWNIFFKNQRFFEKKSLKIILKNIAYSLRYILKSTIINFKSILNSSKRKKIIRFSKLFHNLNLSLFCLRFFINTFRVLFYSLIIGLDLGVRFHFRFPIGTMEFV